MVEVSPFMGIHYNKNKVNISTVTAPPYDIISPEMQEELHTASPYNLVRLTLGKQLPQDTEANNRYTRAAELFDTWQENQILVSDKKPAIYPYQVDYVQDGKSLTLTGFFALLKIDPHYSSVKAHEHTLAKPKEDRLKLMRATSANLEPIELIYQDDEHSIDKKLSNISKEASPLFDVQAWNGRNRFWSLQGEIAQEVCDILRDKKVYIADGHHRYQTAINYWGENKKAAYRMALFVNMSNPGLTILPTHRLIFNLKMDIKDVLKKAKKYFEIAEEPEKNAARIMKKIKGKKNVFALYTGTCYILTLKKEFTGYEDENHSRRWYSLDVSVLQEIFLKKVLGIEVSNVEDYVHYTRFEEDAITRVDTGDYQMALFLNPISMDDVKFLATRGEYLPQKSTYFLPKILSGLVMHKF